MPDCDLWERAGYRQGLEPSGVRGSMQSLDRLGSLRWNVHPTGRRDRAPPHGNGKCKCQTDSRVAASLNFKFGIRDSAGADFDCRVGNIIVYVRCKGGVLRDFCA